MRFVHIADVHLDTSFAGRSQRVRRRLRQASREAFARAVDLAVREDVHALLIAGDLFDGDRLSFETERFLLDQIARLHDADVTVVYATGNHDPGTREAGPRRLSWPGNVLVAADGTPHRFAIHDRDGATVGFVTAAGHATAQVTDDLSRHMPAPEGHLPEVALLHTQVRTSLGAGAHGAYAPSELTFLTRAGFDYWALGHVHVRQMLSHDPPVAYPGNLQGRTHADTGPRGALLVDLGDRGSPSVTFRPLAPVRWETLEVNHLEAADTLDRLEGRIRSVWEAERSEDGEATEAEWMVRVLLQGPCPLWSALRSQDDLDTLSRELRELLGALDVTVVADGVHAPLLVEEQRTRADVLGETLRLVEAVRRGEAVLSGLTGESLAGVASDDPQVVAAYVRELLDGADGEAAARLLVREGPP